MEEEQRKDFAYVGVNVAVQKSLRSRLAIIFTVKKVMVTFISFIINLRIGLTEEEEARVKE